MRHEAVTCDLPLCTAHAAVPRGRTFPPDWWVVYSDLGGWHFCSLAHLTEATGADIPMTMYMRPTIFNSSSQVARG